MRQLFFILRNKTLKLIFNIAALFHIWQINKRLKAIPRNSEEYAELKTVSGRLQKLRKLPY
jgi:hypothetical protein